VSELRTTVATQDERKKRAHIPRTRSVLDRMDPIMLRREDKKGTTRVSDGRTKKTSRDRLVSNSRGLNDVELSFDQGEDTDEKFDGVSEGGVE